MSADPPVGRIGYVMDGLGGGRSCEGAPSEIRCNVCRVWFDSRQPACPVGHERPGFSKPLRTGQLNRHLYEQAGLRPKSGDFQL